MNIAPHPIPLVKPLQVTVTLSGIDGDRVEVDFDGSEMKMGYNRPVLENSGGRFVGQTTLPVCITGAMKWTATVLVTAENRRIAAPFHFDVGPR